MLLYHLYSATLYQCKTEVISQQLLHHTITKAQRITSNMRGMMLQLALLHGLGSIADCCSSAQQLTAARTNQSNIIGNKLHTAQQQ
jgi:hypothetical protein